MSSVITKRKLNTRAVCGRYGVCNETIRRWTEAGILPPPMWINGLKFWDEEELEARDREREPMTRASRLSNLTRKTETENVA